MCENHWMMRIHRVWMFFEIYLTDESQCEKCTLTTAFDRFRSNVFAYKWMCCYHFSTIIHINKKEWKHIFIVTLEMVLSFSFAHFIWALSLFIQTISQYRRLNVFRVRFSILTTLYIFGENTCWSYHHIPIAYWKGKIIACDVNPSESTNKCHDLTMKTERARSQNCYKCPSEMAQVNKWWHFIWNEGKPLFMN